MEGKQGKEGKLPTPHHDDTGTTGVVTRRLTGGKIPSPSQPYSHMQWCDGNIYIYFFLQEKQIPKPDSSTLNSQCTPSTEGTAKQKAPCDGVHRIRVDFKEDYDIENVWDMGGLSILTSVPITPQVVCFLCASSGNVEVGYILFIIAEIQKWWDVFLWLVVFSLFSARCAVNPSTSSAWGRQNAPMKNSGRTGVVADAAFAMSVAGSIRKPK